MCQARCKRDASENKSFYYFFEKERDRKKQQGEKERRNLLLVGEGAADTLAEWVGCDKHLEGAVHRCPVMDVDILLREKKEEVAEGWTKCKRERNTLQKWEGLGGKKGHRTQMERSRCERVKVTVVLSPGARLTLLKPRS